MSAKLAPQSIGPRQVQGAPAQRGSAGHPGIDVSGSDLKKLITQIDQLKTGNNRDFNTEFRPAGKTFAGAGAVDFAPEIKITKVTLNNTPEIGNAPPQPIEQLGSLTEVMAQLTTPSNTKDLREALGAYVKEVRAIGGLSNG